MNRLNNCKTAISSVFIADYSSCELLTILQHMRDNALEKPVDLSKCVFYVPETKQFTDDFVYN